jgi:hypothetical protein
VTLAAALVVGTPAINSGSHLDNYALKEIRACLEAELLTDVQQRLALLSRDMDGHNGQRIPHQPA